jgi:hypothetical protein
MLIYVAIAFFLVLGLGQLIVENRAAIRAFPYRTLVAIAVVYERAGRRMRGLRSAVNEEVRARLDRR